MPNAPAASCASVVVERTRVTTSTPELPGIPARNGFTAYVVLSPVTGSFATVASRIWFCHCPVGLTKPPQDLTQRRGVRTTRFCRTLQHLSSARLVTAHRSFNPPCDPSRAKRCRVHRTPSRVRDDRDTPLVSAKSARMCERAVRTNRPSLELSPLRPKGGRACDQSEGQLR